jgi:hypothetical protein
MGRRVDNALLVGERKVKKFARNRRGRLLLLLLDFLLVSPIITLKIINLLLSISRCAVKWPVNTCSAVN